LANPQLENGYTKISNELLEAICKTRLSDYEHRVLMMIIRKTYGFNKKADWICLKKLSDDTEIRLPHISRTITNLLERNIISKQKRKVSIQKDYEKWLPKEVTKTGGDWRNGNNWKSSTTKNIKDNILKRDNRECRVCGSKSDLCVHHIDYNQDNNKDDNLITLCRSCHQKTNSKNQSEWVTFLGNITQRGNHKKVTNPGNNITYTGNKKLPKQVDTKEKKETIQKKGRTHKKRFLDFVLLTDEEYNKLVDRLGKAKTDDMIDRLNNYIGSKGKRYKSHYHTILTWIKKEPKPQTIGKKYERVT
jgi:phage replication O-like protein O